MPQPIGGGGGVTKLSELYNVVTKAANYTASAEDVVLADASGGAIIITLPSPSPNIKVEVKKIDSTANTVTISQSASETIDGNTSIDITTQYESYTVVSDGVVWYVV